MLSILGSVMRAGLVLIACVSVAMFIVTPAVKYVLVSAFTSLSGSEGTASLVRRGIAYPIVALLSRQRKARRGDFEAASELFVLDLAVGVVGSVWIQGFVTTFCTLVGLWVLFITGYLAMSE